jgi:hypothetical protein
MDRVVSMEQWQKQWMLKLMDSYKGNRLLAAKRMAEISKKEIQECWQLLDEVMPMSIMERERYCSLGIKDRDDFTSGRVQKRSEKLGQEW